MGKTEKTRFSGIARSTYYYHIKQQSRDKCADKKADIVEIFDKNKGIYGFHRITEQLKKKGYSINHKTVLKLLYGQWCYGEFLWQAKG